MSSSKQIQKNCMVSSLFSIKDCKSMSLEFEHSEDDLIQKHKSKRNQKDRYRSGMNFSKYISDLSKALDKLESEISNL